MKNQDLGKASTGIQALYPKRFLAKEKTMKKLTLMMFLLWITACFTASPVFASLAESTATMVEGAVEFPMGLVKLVGGLVWTVGEVLIFPFKALF